MGLTNILNFIRERDLQQKKSAEEQSLADFYTKYDKDPNTPLPSVSDPTQAKGLRDFITQQTDKRGTEAAFRELSPFIQPSMADTRASMPGAAKGRAGGELPTLSQFTTDATQWAQGQGIDPKYALPVINTLKEQGNFQATPSIVKMGETPWVVDGETMRPPEGYVAPVKTPTAERIVDWGYGQKKNLDTGEIFPIPTAPASASGSGTPYYSPVQTAKGVYAFNARTGQMELIDAAGAPVVGSASDPRLQGEIAAARASGELTGKTGTQAKIDLPQHIQEADDTVALIDNMLAHPGLKQAVGTSSLLGVQKVPGTEARSFTVALDQLKGKQFLQAFQSLKGGGQITEVEGQKATQAISRMDTANTEKEFIAASREFQGIIRKGVERAKQKAGGVQQLEKIGTTNPDPLGLR